MTNTKKSHVHAEVIKAWADGAEIELYDDQLHKWISPVTVVKYHGITQSTDKGWEDCNHTTGYHYLPENVRSTNPNKWKLIAIVKTTFVDNVPVAVELVK